MGIILRDSGNASLAGIPPNLTNPTCIGTVGNLQPPGYNPYTSGQSRYQDTNSSYPLNFDQNTTLARVAQWCPYDLQVNGQTGPGNDVYIYPDGDIHRPPFDPCFSACAKYNDDADCCTGSHSTPSTCSPSAYSRAAKAVCPDAYSYGTHPWRLSSYKLTFALKAYDDQTSTFIIPSGAGFEVVFCPGARSTNILATGGTQLRNLASQGHVKRQDNLVGEMVSEHKILPAPRMESDTPGHSVLIGSRAFRTIPQLRCMAFLLFSAFALFVLWL